MSFVPFSEELIERFWAKVEKKGPDECWRWTGNITRDGYGQICQHFSGSSYSKNRKRKMWGAHRFSFTLRNGYTPNFCCHSCDNKWCVNPNHLWNGTCKSNAEDMVAKGRSTAGERNPTAKYTNEQIREAKKLVTDGYTATEISRMTGIGFNTTRYLVHGTRWVGI